MKQFVVFQAVAAPPADPALFTEHAAFLLDGYRKGKLLLLGSMDTVGRTFLLAQAGSRAALEAYLASSPLGQAGLAAYEIHEFTPLFPDAPEPGAGPFYFSDALDWEGGLFV
jgi:uncharacterized protein YciI